MVRSLADQCSKEEEILAEHVTFWRMRVQPGKAEELRQLMDTAADDQRLRELGWVMSIAGRRKESPDEVWGCVTWDTSDRYYAPKAPNRTSGTSECVASSLLIPNGSTAT